MEATNNETTSEEKQLQDELWRGQSPRHAPNIPYNPGIIPGNLPENDNNPCLCRVWTMAERM